MLHSRVMLSYIDKFQFLDLFCACINVLFLLVASICSVMSKDTGEVEAVHSPLLQQVRKETASSSSSSADPEPKKRRKLDESFNREDQFQTSPFYNRVNLIDVLPQMHAGSDATKLHPQTPFTSYVPSYSTITVIAMVHFCHVSRLFCRALDLYTHSNVWFDERMNV